MQTETIVPPVIENEQLPTAKKADELKTLSYYNQRLRPLMRASDFEPFPLRTLWAGGFIATIALAFFCLTHFELIWPLKAFLGILLGICYGSLGFFAHELLHGSVFRNRKIQNFLGFFCFMPFFISPTFWRYWHNLLHHGKTQSLIEDPDAFPLLKIYKQSRFMRFMYPFTPGSGHKRSLMYFFFWFSFHVFVAQTYLRFRNSVFSKLDHKRVTLEMASQILIWAGFLIWLGPSNLIWTFLIPLFAQNYFAMSYIATNHNLSPLTRVNDPLVNSLTVTNIPILEWLNLNFGYHVEHHIFPTVSGVHAKKVHRLLQREFPNDYQYLPKYKAIKALYRTARIYKTAKVLTNPETGETYGTIEKGNI